MEQIKEVVVIKSRIRREMDGKGNILDYKVKADSLKKWYLNWSLSIMKVSNISLQSIQAEDMACAKGLSHEKEWVSEDRKATAAGVSEAEKDGVIYTGVRDTGGARSQRPF